jgi:hypothetical protein
VSSSNLDWVPGDWLRALLEVVDDGGGGGGDSSIRSER